MPAQLRPTVRFVSASDGVRLAWTESGSGPPLVKAATWLTHLEYDTDSPVWRHWTRCFSDHFRYVRYDERGSGMSDWDVHDLSLERRVDDMERVIDAAGLDEPFVLFGISQGGATCISYALRHPERVARMVLCGSYARGALRRDDPRARRAYDAIIELTSLWGSDNPAFRQVFTSNFIPQGTDDQLRWFNELCQKCVRPDMAAALLRARAEVDIAAQVAGVRVPTLVLHGRKDAVVPISEGRFLAAEIPDAQFIELESSNHVLLEHEPAWTRFTEALLAFTGRQSASDATAFAALSPREREVLALLEEGRSNADIAERLGISEKTVRNHLSHLFDKLGVWSRTQAVVFARDHHFRG